MTVTAVETLGKHPLAEVIQDARTGQTNVTRLLARCTVEGTLSFHSAPANKAQPGTDHEEIRTTQIKEGATKDFSLSLK